MGFAIDSIAGSISGTQSSLTAVTLASGDSNVIRNFNAPAYARLENIMYQATTKGSIQVKSPLLHDNVRGIQFTPGESPTNITLPQEYAQNLIAQDTLTISLSGGTTSEVDAVVLSIYYSNLLGAASRLHMWGDISGIIKNIKPMAVTTGTPTAGTWLDTVITTTEDLLHANTDYAVLGYLVSSASAAIGIKGIDTGNLRVTGPGDTRTINTADYFVALSNRMGTPHIPVFNSANKGSTYVSVMQGTTAAATTVQLILAELTQNLPS